MVSINAWKKGDLAVKFLVRYPRSCMVPYGQASHSPDHERPLTFRSQFFHVCFNTNRAFKMTFGDLRSKPLARSETGENNIPLARYPTGRLCTRTPAIITRCSCMVPIYYSKPIPPPPMERPFSWISNKLV